MVVGGALAVCRGWVPRGFGAGAAPGGERGRWCRRAVTRSTIPRLRKKNPQAPADIVGEAGRFTGDNTSLITTVRGRDPPNVIITDRFAADEVSYLGDVYMLRTTPTPVACYKKDMMRQAGLDSRVREAEDIFHQESRSHGADTPARAHRLAGTGHASPEPEPP